MIDTIYLLRHGMRLDLEDETYWRHYAKFPDDTPLSANGIQQAKETALHLENEGIRHIFASPFFRTLQTADIIAQKLNVSVNVEYGFCEQLNPEWFSGFPEFIQEEDAVKIFPTINTEYRSIVKPVYPELVSSVDVFRRTGITLNEIMNRYDGPILIVGHGASIWETARNLLDPPEGYNMKMCALHKFNRDPDRWKYEYSTTDHLSYIDSW